MKFVLLGFDAAVLPLVRTIARSPHHDLAAAAEAGNRAADLSDEVSRVRFVASWRDLLLERDVDAAIVSGFAPSVLEGAKALANAGINLLVFPDVRQTASFVYALWPIDDERRARLIPVLPHRLDAGFCELDERIRSGEFGRLRVVQLERTLPPGRDGLLELSEVENLLLRDCDLLHWLCGNYSRLTCLPAGSTESGLAMMTVSLSGDGLPEATWRVTASAGKSESRLIITGEHGPVEYELPPPGEVRGHPEPTAADSDTIWNVLLDERPGLQGARPQWPDLVRAFDTVDAARRSARRRRTIEIGSEEISELRQFKSLMTAAGCGVLVYTLFGIVAALLLGAVADPRDAAQRRSAAADFIVHSSEFAPRSAELTDSGRDHVAEIAPRMWQTTADILIQASDPPDRNLDAGRREAVIDVLQAHGAAGADERVVVREFSGAWFERLMLGVWIVVFLPIGILLLMQLLGLAAQQPTRSQP